MAKQTIHDILEIFREEAASKRDLGDKFEKLIANFLTKDPYYGNHFSNVWLWMEWPGRAGQPDTGIDLVAQERATGDFTAVQCKFLDPAHYLQKEDIDSFFTASGKKPFTQRMIISTTDKWGKHAEEALNNQQPPVSHITLTGIPLAAYDYIVNGKPAIEWIIDRYQMTTDKDSGLTNNPNDWAAEHNDPAYILNLLKRIITVSMETMKVVEKLPALNEKK